VLTTLLREKKTHVKKYSLDEILSLETKRSGVKLLPHLDLGVGSVSTGSITQQKTEKGLFFRYMKCLEPVLDLVGVQEFRWDKEGTVRVGYYNLFYGKKIKIISWERDFCTPKNSISS
jgi:hypothetical protein